MALIDRDAREIADPWTYPHADENVPIRAYAVVPADVLVGLSDSLVWERPIGVLLPADAPVGLVAPLLHRVDLVVVPFPKFRDGRGFTTARALRAGHGFQGDIRATGHVLPDQLGLLVQCGFTSVVTPMEHPPEQWSQFGALAPGGRPGQLLNRLLGGRAAAAAIDDAGRM